ncbi:MAG TPA: hypothetical protein DCX19_05520 [Alphaproteobacteria bacterium]|nr:hypothetical protein [Alphaproteobacteria bacterium]
MLFIVSEYEKPPPLSNKKKPPDFNINVLILNDKIKKLHFLKKNVTNLKHFENTGFSGKIAFPSRKQKRIYR